VRALALLVATLMLAGCLSASKPPAATPDPGSLGGLPAMQADLRGTLGNGATVPLATGALLRADATTTGTVPVEPRLHRLSMWLNATDPGVAMLRDAAGHLVCVAKSGRVCSASIDVSAPEQWALAVSSLGPDGGAFDAHVALYAQPGVPRPDGLPAGNLTVARSKEYGGEPTLAWTKDGRIVAASTKVLRLEADRSTFTDVSPPVDKALSQSLDPFLYGDPVTGRIYVTQLDSCMRLSWTDDAGSTWTTNPEVCGGPDQHHQKVATGPSPVPGARAVHIATMNLASWLASDDVVIFHSQSLDGGLAWTDAPAMAKQTAGMEARAVGNIAGLDDGTIAIVAYLCDRFVDAAYNGVAVGRSTDLGATWAWTKVAQGGGRCEGIDPGLATDGKRLWVAWEDLSLGSGHVFWQEVLPNGLSGPAAIPTGNLGSMVFTDAAASPTRLVAAFLGTADTAIGPTQAPGWALWYPYLASLDLTRPDATWQVVRIQDDPVQAGPICMDGPMCLDGARNLLDFIDVQLDPHGRAAVAYADGCEGDCTQSWQSRDAFLRVAMEP
jgi:hypothetical protein